MKKIGIKFVLLLLIMIILVFAFNKRNRNNDTIILIDDPEIVVDNYIKDQKNLGVEKNTYSRKLPVFLYHHIVDEVEEGQSAISKQKFKEHMKIISESGYETITIKDIVDYIEKGIELPEKSLLITFDDGYMSNYEYAYPILKNYNLKATIFVIGSTFGLETYKNSEILITPHFGQKEMEEMEKSGLIEIQSHAFDLHQTDKYEEGITYKSSLILPNENKFDYTFRIINDLRKWEEKINKNVTALAYPLGEYDLLITSILQKYGVKITFTTKHKVSTLIKEMPMSGYNLGRYSMNDSHTKEDIIKILNS